MYTIIHTITPFDASKGGTINFNWSGNQIYKVRCLIRENETGKLVYDDLVDTMKSSYDIPGSTALRNGTYYVAYLTVFDVNGKESSLQPIGTPFYCLSAPTFQLTVTEGDIIRASSYSISLNYHQGEKEPINGFTISLYSYQKSLLQSSDKIYDIDNSYIISGLENANQYYIRAIGTTLNGMQLDTGYILFTVAYIQAQIFSTLELNNKAEIGAIEIRSNIISAEGVADKEVLYIDNRYADLRDNRVVFDIGYRTKGDFSKALLFYKPNLNHEILRFSDQDKDMIVSVIYREGSFADSNGKQAYFELQAAFGYTSYVRFSNFIDIPTENQMFALCITRINHYYDLQTCLVEKEA